MATQFEVSSPRTPENASTRSVAAARRMDLSDSPPCTPTNAASTRLLNCDAPPRRAKAYDVFSRSELERAPKVARALFMDDDDDDDDDENDNDEAAEQGSGFARSPATPPTAGADRVVPTSATPPPSAAALRASKRVGTHEMMDAALDFYRSDARDPKAAADTSAQYSPAVVRKLAFDAVADDEGADEDLSSTPPKQAQPMPIRRIVVVSPTKKGLPPPPPTPTTASVASAVGMPIGGYPAVHSAGLPQTRQLLPQSHLLQQTPIAVRPTTTVMVSGAAVSPHSLQQPQHQMQHLQPLLNVSPGSLIITPEAQQAQVFYSNRETPSPVTMVAGQLRALRLNKATPPALPGRKVL
eukprot:CAMPEP_0206455474 /NCGR_PEP_ID=MMETSP0324_2-20121206/21771_1 /ASSEMBLY_ACC=CAM_ASM_000836 /TAXON_ID=2866 /ORGANISM="Crypthecodinium cohnii, Strain Seligo" /LENGTH=353 /DNA_ID=CAMNT_0053926179 /DNA_START=99 /DNA_END=1160 /DNA_ORIENTATION=+